jgi:hypothetical protein
MWTANEETTSFATSSHTGNQSSKIQFSVLKCLLSWWMMFRKVRSKFKLSDSFPSEEFPELIALQASKQGGWTIYDIHSSLFKKQMLVFFNHFADVWQGVGKAMWIIPLICKAFKLFAWFTNIHNHTPEVYEKGQFPAKPPLPTLEGGIGRNRQIRWANFPPVKLI